MVSKKTAGAILRIGTLSVLVPLAGCITKNSAIDTPPVVAPVTSTSAELRNLPAPSEKVTVSVYDLEDLTGQFKESDRVQTLSKAVTQGGAAILIKSLQDTGERRWFTVLERKDLDNLLKERQILTEMRRLYRGEDRLDANVLPPLKHAGFIIEGAIIGYDTNVVTGGVGARFLAIGGDTKYLQDVVTVTLRVVSTKTGEVLTSVTSRKMVSSYALQGGAFRYLKLDELLEAETGVTYNEPKQLAVEAAVEKAVYSLVIEGAELGIWNFADREAGADLIAAYRGAKYENHLTAEALYPPAPASKPPHDLPDTEARAPGPVRVAARAEPQRTIMRPMPPVMQRVIQGPSGQAPQTGAGGAVPPAQPGQYTPASPREEGQAEPRSLPPAPTPDEPAVGQHIEETPKRRTLFSMLFGSDDEQPAPEAEAETEAPMQGGTGWTGLRDAPEEVAALQTP
ncbi:curli production assembly/transport component CsgG [Fulvimarina manganoxydans]|uniref:Curli production assembly/transport component CsgG n=1 Tax=Fulvimarina manganoxydans TaxID=937218 RepID=A0A1W2D718_9HYPH|nr:CsgG/HfaB family protein [Fulvimarina manganoxydans]SMC93307.1 curli production assembly/transport component CsgG [Fulvimarina manganoxydans]